MKTVFPFRHHVGFFRAPARNRAAAQQTPMQSAGRGADFDWRSQAESPQHGCAQRRRAASLPLNRVVWHVEPGIGLDVGRQALRNWRASLVQTPFNQDSQFPAHVVSRWRASLTEIPISRDSSPGLDTLFQPQFQPQPLVLTFSWLLSSLVVLSHRAFSLATTLTQPSGDTLTNSRTARQLSVGRAAPNRELALCQPNPGHDRKFRLSLNRVLAENQKLTFCRTFKNQFSVAYNASGAFQLSWLTSSRWLRC